MVSFGSVLVSTNSSGKYPVLELLNAPVLPAAWCWGGDQMGLIRIEECPVFVLFLLCKEKASLNNSDVIVFVTVCSAVNYGKLQQSLACFLMKNPTLRLPLISLSMAFPFQMNCKILN